MNDIVQNDTQLNNKKLALLSVNIAKRAPSPTRWCYQSQVKVVAFLKNYFFFKQKKALAFNRDRCCHLVFRLQLKLFH